MITVGDLKDQTIEKGSTLILYCLDCQCEYSANASDYFMHERDHNFMCSCGASLVLAIKRTVFDIVKE